MNCVGPYVNYVRPVTGVRFLATDHNILELLIRSGVSCINNLRAHQLYTVWYCCLPCIWRGDRNPPRVMHLLVPSQRFCPREFLMLFLERAKPPSSDASAGTHLLVRNPRFRPVLIFVFGYIVGFFPGSSQQRRISSFYSAFRLRSKIIVEFPAHSEWTCIY